MRFLALASETVASRGNGITRGAVRQVDSEGCKNGLVATAYRRRRARPGRRGVLSRGTELLQSVANDVAPGVVSAIDVDGVVQRIDIQATIERVDLNAVLDQLDMDALLARVDMAKLIDKVDMNAILERVDIDALIEQTHMGSIMARSGGAVAARAGDIIRSHGVDLDNWLHRWADRLLRRKAMSHPSGPPALLHDPEQASL